MKLTGSNQPVARNELQVAQSVMVRLAEPGAAGPATRYQTVPGEIRSVNPLVIRFNTDDAPQQWQRLDPDNSVPTEFDADWIEREDIVKS